MRNFPNWLRAYMQYTRDSESPSLFHFWTGVSTVAGALRRRVWLDMRKFQWTPNFYIVLVGPAGVAAKSTSMSMGVQLLSKVPDIKFGPESGTWQKLTKSLSEAMEYCQYVLPDGTIEKAGMSCVTIAISELGTFLHTDDDTLISFMTRMWDGQKETIRHDTLSGGNIVIENPWINLIAATTPTWLKQNFPSHMIGGGFTSRIVFVYGDKKRHLQAYPDEAIPGPEYIDLHTKLLADLVSISKLAGPYQLSTMARNWGRQWYKEHNDPDLRPAHLNSGRFDGYIARKQTHIHKFAMIIAASKRDALVIEEDDLVEANLILTNNEQDMLKVFESIGVVDQKNHVMEIVNTVMFVGFCTSNHLWTKCMNMMSLRDFHEAVRAAIHGNLIEVVKRGNVEGVVLKGKQP